MLAEPLPVGPHRFPRPVVATYIVATYVAGTR
jgi:hypothetical protein